MTFDATPLLYRLEHYALTNGPKQAGFVLCVPSSTLLELSTIETTPGQVARLAEMCKDRLHNLYAARMVRKRLLDSASVTLLGTTPVPRFFSADPVFGGSLGADPETFSRFRAPNALEWLGPEVAYTPHNVDTATTSVMLTVLVVTWAEWAQTMLYKVALERSQKASLSPTP